MKNQSQTKANSLRVAGPAWIHAFAGGTAGVGAIFSGDEAPSALSQSAEVDAWSIVDGPDARPDWWPATLSWPGGFEQSIDHARGLFAPIAAWRDARAHSDDGEQASLADDLTDDDIADLAPDVEKAIASLQAEISLQKRLVEDRAREAEALFDAAKVPHLEGGSCAVDRITRFAFLVSGRPEAVLERNVALLSRQHALTHDQGAISAQTDRVTCLKTSSMAIDLMLSEASARGWKTISVVGEPEFRASLTKAAVSKGFAVRDEVSGTRTEIDGSVVRLQSDRPVNSGKDKPIIDHASDAKSSVKVAPDPSPKSNTVAALAAEVASRSEKRGRKNSTRQSGDRESDDDAPVEVIVEDAPVEKVSLIGALRASKKAAKVVESSSAMDRATEPAMAV